jgi:hypothetical protein
MAYREPHYRGFVVTFCIKFAGTEKAVIYFIFIYSTG